METIYRVEDKEFIKQDDALRYEQRLAQEKAERDKLFKEKQTRFNEIDTKSKELKTLMDKFNTDYGYTYFTSDSDFINIFNALFEL